MKACRRPLWFAAGALWLVAGTAGIVLPLLPTVDCYALALFCWMRADPRAAEWLRRHRFFGPLLRQARGAMPLRARLVATLALAASAGWALHAAPPAVAALVAVVCAAVALLLWTRPWPQRG